MRLLPVAALTSLCVLTFPAIAQHAGHGAGATPSGASKTVPAPPAETAATNPVATAKASIVGNDRKALGTVTLREGPTGVLIRVELDGALPPGWRGMHFHAVGTCEDEKFLASGAHLNHSDPTTKKPHGLLNAGGPDFGDLPNLYTGADGRTFGEVMSPLITLGTVPGRASVFDADGTALVIHASEDDHTSQPIGGAGARVACGVIERG